MILKFYKAQVTGAGYMPEGDCQATLQLDEARNPTWSDVSEEFERLALPWFTNTVRMGIFDNPEPFKPFSDEALDHLKKHQLPSVGFVMVTISSGKPKKAETTKEEPAEGKDEKKPAPPKLPASYRNVGFSPPPHIFKKE